MPLRSCIRGGLLHVNCSTLPVVLELTIHPDCYLVNRLTHCWLEDKEKGPVGAIIVDLCMSLGDALVCGRALKLTDMLPL